MRTEASCKIRSPAAAGRFYSGDPVELRRQVTELLAGASGQAGPAPKALIAPHAGYTYSGPIAASAYARLIPDRDRIHRVVLLGPSHYMEFHGCATSSAEGFQTPLGTVPLDQEAIRQLGGLPQVQTSDEAHQREHSLEVHLPFLQVVLKEFSLVPLLAGVADAGEISEVLDLLWNGESTRLVISSDLSHFLDAAAARLLDRQTANAIETLEPESIAENQACGRVPIRGLLQAVRRHGLRASTIDLRNSSDTSGLPDRVVGYGAFVFG